MPLTGSSSSRRKLPVSKLMPKLVEPTPSMRSTISSPVKSMWFSTASLTPACSAQRHGAAELLDERLHLRSVRLLAPGEARADDAHDVGADGDRVLDAAHHVVVLGGLLAALEAVGVAPGVHAVEAVLVELGLEVGKILAVEAREEAGLQRDAVDAELLGAVEEVVHRHLERRLLLLRVDLAEEAVEAVAVDADLHRDSGHGRGLRVRVRGCEDEVVVEVGDDHAGRRTAAQQIEVGIACRVKREHPEVMGHEQRKAGGAAKPSASDARMLPGTPRLAR